MSSATKSAPKKSTAKKSNSLVTASKATHKNVATHSATAAARVKPKSKVSTNKVAQSRSHDQKSQTKPVGKNSNLIKNRVGATQAKSHNTAHKAASHTTKNNPINKAVKKSPSISNKSTLSSTKSIGSKTNAHGSLKSTTHTSHKPATHALHKPTTHTSHKSAAHSISKKGADSKNKGAHKAVAHNATAHSTVKKSQTHVKDKNSHAKTSTEKKGSGANKTASKTLLAKRKSPARRKPKSTLSNIGDKLKSLFTFNS